MELNVDKRKFFRLLKWSKLAETNEIVLIADDDAVKVQLTNEKGGFYESSLEADVLELGSVQLNRENLKQIEALTGETIQITLDGASLSLETEEGSIDFAVEPVEPLSSPQYTVIGSTTAAALKKALVPLKECVGKKTEKSADFFLEGIFKVENSKLTVGATNRFAAFVGEVRLQDSHDYTQPFMGFQPLKWTNALEFITGDIDIIATATHFGFKQESMVALFPMTQPNKLASLIDVLKNVPEEHEVKKVSLNKRKLMNALNSLKKASLYGRLSIKEGDAKLKIESTSPVPSENTPQNMSFSIDYEGDNSLNFVEVNPAYLAKVINHLKMDQVELFFPSDPRIPMYSRLEEEGVEGLGLVMTIQR